MMVHILLPRHQWRDVFQRRKNDMELRDKRSTFGWCVFVPMLLLTAGQAVCGIQPGDSREQVIQELGSTRALMKFGAFETLDYEDGTRVFLKDGVVSEVSHRSGVLLSNQNPRTGGSPKAQMIARDTARSTNVTKRSGPTFNERMPLPSVEGAPGGSRRVGANTSRLPPPIQLPETNLAHAHRVEAAVETPAPTVAPPSTDFRPRPTLRTNQHPVLTFGSVDVRKTLDSKLVLSPGFRRLAGGLVVLVGALILSVYAFGCYCLARICDKAGEPSGLLVWIPLVQFIPLLRVAQMPLWTLILLIVPLVNIVIVLLLWAKICAGLGRSPWMAALLLVPVANFGLLVYLAFCHTPSRGAQNIDRDAVSGLVGAT